MDGFQKATVTEFFKPFPTVSPSLCHQFVLDDIAPAFFLNTDQADVQPSPLQGSMSYTTIRPVIVVSGILTCGELAMV